MQNNAHFIGPHQTAVAVATLVLIGTEWLAALHWAFRALPGVQTATERSSTAVSYWCLQISMAAAAPIFRKFDECLSDAVT